MSTRVVLLTIDTLRADKLNQRCFPNLMDTIESDFARFTNAYSHGNATPLAFPGIIAGHPVIGDGRFPDDVATIAELFEGPTSGFSNNGYLTQERGYHRGFDLFHDQHPPDRQSESNGDTLSVDTIRESLFDYLRSFEWVRESELPGKMYRRLQRLNYRIRGENVYDLEMPAWSGEQVTEFVLRRMRSDDQFVWGHYMDAHKPFIPMEGVESPSIDKTPEELRYLNSYEHEKDPLPADEIRLLDDLYESNIQYCDLVLSQLIDQMKEDGKYEDTLIVITGDHGELFGEHGYMFHPMDIDPVDELIRVPLFVKYPGGSHAGEVFDHNVQHRDIIATVTHTLDLSSADISEDTYRLTKPNTRRIISKSNTAIRLTEGDSVGIRRRNGDHEYPPSLSDAGREAIESASFPAVRTNAGEVKGVEEAERQQQLRALGYR